MFAKIINLDVRVVLFLISVALFVIGAGAPAATGG
jgi:hypothetical protein